MTKKKAEAGRKRKGFSPEFRQKALLRAATEGVPAVAQDLGLQPEQLYAWRAKAQQQGQDRRNGWRSQSRRGYGVRWRGWRRRSPS